jgi:predicted nucleic-acid-binding protein
LIGLDTNVLVRYLVQDDPAQSKLATKFIEKNCTDSEPGIIGHIVLCELSWVLEGNYQQSRDQIANVIEQILQVSQLAIPNTELIWRALSDYRDSNADFSDHLLSRINQATGCEYTLTFDKKAAKQGLFELLKA